MDAGDGPADWQSFSDTEIDAQPTPVACAMRELRKADRALSALWRACDLIELILRMSATMLFAELRTQPDAIEHGTAVLRKSEFNFLAPTLGMWKRLLVTLLDESSHWHTTMPELASARSRLDLFFDGSIDRLARPGERPAVDLPRYERSFSSLRNRMAHGAGLTDEAAAHLISIWRQPIRAFLDEHLAWLGQFRFYGRPGGLDAARYLLHGLSPLVESCVAQTEESDEQVWAEREGARLKLWPLVIFGVPRVPPHKVTLLATQVYSNLETTQDGRVFYTPYTGVRPGSPDEVLYWSQGEPRARSSLVESFRVEVDPALAKARGATAVFGAEIRAEGRRMMGRERAVQRILASLRQAGHAAMWLHGPAGVGKSMLVAKAALRLLDEKRHADSLGEPSSIVVLYRFRYGDPRCSSESFVSLVAQTLRADASAARKGSGAGMGRDGGSEVISSLLADITSRNRSVILLVDGLDEIDEVEPRFIDEMLAPLLRPSSGPGSVKWLLAGRSHLSGAMLRAGAVELDFGGANGVPGLEEKDVWAMLLDGIGTAREGLLRGTSHQQRAMGAAPIHDGDIRLLEKGVVPSHLLEALKGASWQPTFQVPHATEQRPDEQSPRGQRVWLIDDDDDAELYFVTIRRNEDLAHLHASALSSPFVQSIVENSRDDEASGTGLERKSLALYVKYVIDDIRSGQVGYTASAALDPAWLPRGLSLYYEKMVERMRMGGVSSLLTPLVNLLVVAREPLSVTVLARVLDLPEFLDVAEREAMVTEAIDSLRSVLRTRMGVGAEQSTACWTVYHHSFREYLLRPYGPGGERFQSDPHQPKWIKVAQGRLAAICREAARNGVAEGGPLAGYIQRHGVAHLCDLGELAAALRLLVTLIAQDGSGLALVAVRAQRSAIADALTQAISQGREAPLAALDPNDLATLIGSHYETGFSASSIRILIEYHGGDSRTGDGAWQAIRARLLTPFDLVFRHDTGQAYADIWSDAHDATDKSHWMETIEAMSRSDDDYLREIAGYALKRLYDLGELVPDPALIDRFARGCAIMDRMVAGELLLTLAVKGRPVGAPVGDARFWEPLWPYLRTDIDSLHVLASPDVASLAAQASDPELAACARSQLDNEALRHRLAGLVVLQQSPLLAPLLGSATEQMEAANSLSDPSFVDELAKLVDLGHQDVALAFIRMLASHPLWNVAEEMSSALRMLVARNQLHARLIEVLLEDSSWRVRYCAIDSAFNIGAFDDFAHFRKALIDNARHPHHRVRGICADDFLGWLRTSSATQRDSIMSDDALAGVLASWLARAEDSWLLEYVYLMFRFLGDNPSALIERRWVEWMSGPRTPYLRGRKPFYMYPHQRFLRVIDRLRRRRGARGEPY